MNPKKHYFARIPGIVLYPAGGLALAEHPSVHSPCHRPGRRKKERLQTQYSSDFRTAPSGSGYAHDEASEEQRKAKQRHKTLTLLCACFGGLFLLAGLAGLPDALAFLTWESCSPAWPRWWAAAVRCGWASAWTAPASWSASWTGSWAAGTISPGRTVCRRRCHYRRGPLCFGQCHRPRIFWRRCLY